MRLTVIALMFAVLGSIGQAPAPQLERFRVTTFHYQPAAAGASDVIRVRMSYKGHVDVEYIGLPNQTRLALVDIKGPESWVPRVRPPAESVDSAPGRVMQHGDTVELLIPLAEFFERYELDEGGQVLVLTIPIPIGDPDGTVRLVRVTHRMTIFAPPENWICNQDPKRVLESYYRRISAGALDAARPALPPALDDEEATSRLREAQVLLSSADRAVMILDSKAKKDHAIVFMRVIEGTSVRPLSVYLRRVEGCWRVVDAAPEEPAVQELFEAWSRKAMDDYFLGG